MILEHSNPRTVYNEHKELLQSGTIRKIQHMVLTLPIGALFWAIDTTLAKSPILQQEEFSSLISAMKIVQTLPRWDKCVRVLCDKKIMTVRWNNCPSFYVVCDCHSNYEYDIRNRTSWTVFVFIVLYTVLFHNQKLSFLLV